MRNAVHVAIHGAATDSYDDFWDKLENSAVFVLVGYGVARSWLRGVPSVSTGAGSPLKKLRSVRIATFSNKVGGGPLISDGRNPSKPAPCRAVAHKSEGGPTSHRSSYE